ncbi:uncharacterized protein LOC144772699 [Lissotriton helveticus]
MKQGLSWVCIIIPDPWKETAKEFAQERAEEGIRLLSQNRMMRPMMVWMVLLFPHICLATRDQEVSGTLGGSLTVHCRYSGHLKGHSRYWCKGYYRNFCTILVQTTGSEGNAGTERLSITDDHSTHTFMVTMRALTKNDAGDYWCGTERSDRDEMSYVQVTILSTDPNFKPTNISPNLKVANPITLTASLPLTAAVLPWSAHKEIQITLATVTASALTHPSPEETNSTSDTSNTTADDTQGARSTLSAQMLLLSLVPAALLGMLLLVIVISWGSLRNKNKSLDEEGSQRDVDIALVNLPVQDMFENPLYDSMEEASCVDGTAVYSVVKRIPASGVSKPYYEEVPSLYSAAKVLTKPNIRGQLATAPRNGQKRWSPAGASEHSKGTVSKVGEAVHRQVDITMANTHQQDMLEDVFCVRVDIPTTVDQTPVYSVIERVPAKLTTA